MSSQIFPYLPVKPIVRPHLRDGHVQHIIHSLTEIKTKGSPVQGRIFSVHKLLHLIRIVHNIQKYTGEAVLRPFSGSALSSAYYMISLSGQNIYTRNLLQYCNKQEKILIQFSLGKTMPVKNFP